MKDYDFEDISALIRQEEEDALAYFRTRNFQNRVENCLEEAAAGKQWAFSLRRTAVPVLATVLVVIMSGAFFFILKRPVPNRPPEFRALSSALGQLPGFSHPRGRGWTAPPGQTRTSWLAESIRQALVTAERIKSKEEQRISVPAATRKVPRLSLYQKMEILFKEKTIERALLLFKNDSKEV